MIIALLAILYFFLLGLAFIVFIGAVTGLGAFLVIKRWLSGQPIRGRRDPNWPKKGKK